VLARSETRRDPQDENHERRSRNSFPPAHQTLGRHQAPSFVGWKTAEKAGFPTNRQQPYHGVPTQRARRFDSWQAAASVLAVAWDRENTRKEISEAMSRKEVHAANEARISLSVMTLGRFLSSFEKPRGAAWCGSQGTRRPGFNWF
jgi:hypothetical protein